MASFVNMGIAFFSVCNIYGFYGSVNGLMNGFGLIFMQMCILFKFKN